MRVSGFIWLFRRNSKTWATIPTDFRGAMDKAYMWGDVIPIGLFWKRTDLPSLDELEPVLAEGGPLSHRPLGVSPEIAQSLIRELM